MHLFDTAKKKQRTPEWIIARLFLFVVLGLPGIYLLSYGPACSVTARGWMSANTYYSLYNPVPKSVREAYLKIWVRLDNGVLHMALSGGY